MKMHLAVFALLFSLAACRGPAGPAGPRGEQGLEGPPGTAGPGTRLVMTGTVDSAGDYATNLPAAAGSTLENPPAMDCFIMDPTRIPWWRPIGDGWNSTTDPYCALAFDASRDVFRAEIHRARVGWSVAIVIVY